jgi:hypothetical protein
MRTALALALIGTGLAAAAARPVEASPRQDVQAAREPGRASSEDGLLPRRPIGALHGFESRSALRYAAAPDVERTFEAFYVFPDRARWEFELADGSQRRVFRLGPDAFFAADRASQPLGEPQHVRLVGEMELRRATMLWPDGFAWRPVEGGDAGGQDREVDLCEPGRLRAVAGEGGRPVQVQLLGPDGTELEAYRAIRWQEVAGRTWPQSMELWHAGARLWTETVEHVAPARYVDAFFVPPDRRPQAGGGQVPEGVQSLPASTVLRVPLERSGWDEAIAAERRLRGEWTGKLSGHELAPRPAFELDPEGRPVAVLLRVESLLEPPPAGWRRLPGREGLSLFLRLADLDAGHLERLRAGLPEASRALAAYALVDTEKRLAQLVLPFER